MAELAKEIVPVNIEDELKQSYLDYSMSVIVGRALPDVRDGLKPVHRRILFAMHELKNDWNKPYKKSARVVGDVIGKYHPHGDTAVYDTIVRMAQPFSLRYPLIDGQGNFGSVDGDNAAAMRYTEIRMARIAHELLADLEKETVDFAPNYDGSEQIPVVLPARVPNLLVSGSSGIAVGMATNIPPHNLGEIIDGVQALIINKDISIDELMEHIPGPDFPTAGFINGRGGIVQAYRTGRGRIYMRARANIETKEKNNRQTIIVTEIPYQVNKARLIEKIAELVRDKKLEGISELRDESDKDGMRIVIELKRAEVAEVVLNNLYSQTQMECVFGINMVALTGGQPRIMNLKQILEAFVRHRREVVTRRTVFELAKARARVHLLEGLTVSLANIDEVIALIKASPNSAAAKEGLLSKPWEPGRVVQMLERAGSDEATRPDGLSDEYGLHDGKYHLSPEQAQAILELRLHRLTGLEQEKLASEYEEILERIKGLMAILADPALLIAVIVKELNDIKDQYNDERRTEILSSKLDLTNEDLITEENVVVTLSHGGYAKIQSVDIYQAQRRGGRGKAATAVKDEDYVEHLLVTSTHDTILCFSDKGKVYWLKVYQLPQAGRTSKGKPIINILPLDKEERITSILPLREYKEGQFVFMATSNGTVKKVSAEYFTRPRPSGLIAIELEGDNTLVGAAITDGNQDLMLLGSNGKAIRFKEEDVRPMGRTARGVRGIRLNEGVKLISLIVVNPEAQLLTASLNGYGKRTNMQDFAVQGRGGQGVIAMQINERNGTMVGAVQVDHGEEIMLISDKGTLVRTRVDEVSVQGRNTQGVILIRLSEGEHMVGLERIEEISNGDETASADGDSETISEAVKDDEIKNDDENVSDSENEDGVSGDSGESSEDTSGESDTSDTE